jgi:hypothetical protein
MPRGFWLGLVNGCLLSIVAWWLLALLAVLLLAAVS